ncbi:uncharacterized protein [Montipora capricornis]|uniref:uncharacterized protein n=1 Tax=Montipora capricornis TaxID=246305 RepID=UPI0035F1AAF3
MFSTTQQHFLLALICFLFLVQNPWNSLTCTAVVLSFTSHNQALFGFVFKKTENIDWLQCIQACQQDVSCVSYNYWPTESGGKCEMNSCGFKDKCSAERMLTWVREGTFQQLKKTKDFKSSCNRGIGIDATNKKGVLQASFSCHQRMVIYADGKILTRNSRASFEDVHCSEFLSLAVNFTIPKTTKLIAIRAEASKDGAKIIGSFTDGVVTDSQWKCSSNDVSGWFLPQFDDLCWTPAHELSATDHSGATDEQQIVGVLPSAKWINTGDLSPIIKCRLHRKVT